MTRPPLRVSDHALIRYMERVMGLDFTDIKATILKATDAAYHAGALRVSACGVTYHFAGNSVSTIDNCHSPQTSIRRGNAHSNKGRPKPAPGNTVLRAKGDRRRPEDESWCEEMA